MVEGALTHLGGRSPPPSPIDIKAPSAEQPCINRPRPRGEHRHADGQDRKKDVDQRRLAQWTTARHTFHASARATSPAMTGVHKPASRKMPPAAASKFCTKVTGFEASAARPAIPK